MRRLIVTSCVLAFMGCGGGSDSGSGDDAAASIAPLGSGSITGVISFAGMAPSNPTIDMADETECAAKYTGTPVDPIVSVTDGNLGNVLVRVISGLPAGPYPMPSQPARIDQDGCLYHPRVVGAMVGQAIEITNSDPLLHNIKAVPTPLLLIVCIRQLTARLS